MTDTEHNVVYRAIADFTNLYVESQRAEQTIDKLGNTEASANQKVAKSEDTVSAAKNKRAKAEQDVASAASKSRSETERGTTANEQATRRESALQGIRRV